MKKHDTMGLHNVQQVYSGPEGALWELIMGEQIHIGGFQSSMELAEKAGVAEGMRGVDFCCCTGAGMRFLIRFHGAAHMTGVDATETVVSQGRRRCMAEGLADQINFVLAEVTDSRLPDASADFVWGEDAWCYVQDKPKMLAEAARIVKPGGTIAFTDWIEGPAGLSDDEAQRFLTFMKFPNVLALKDYSDLLTTNGCTVERAEDTARFKPHVDLYLNMLTMQLTYDALKIIGFDTAVMEAMGGEMAFMQELAGAGKIAQGLFIARKQ
jgi:sarcosine/dimethylglycine N-methyltransferase